MTGTDPDRELFDAEKQTIDPSENRRRALEGLAAEWDRAWDNPYYGRRFQDSGLTRDAFPDLDDIPRTTKDDLRADVQANPPFGTHRSVTLDNARRVGTSTGTTGKPWLQLWTERDMAAAIDVRMQYLWRAGMRPGGRFAHSWPTGMYSTGVLAGRDFLRAGIMEIPCGLPTTPKDIETHLDLWELLSPTGFMLTGSQVQIYDAAAKELGKDLRTLFGGGSLLIVEALYQFEGPRKRFEEEFGVRAHNITGASEVPAFSINDCRHHSGMHVPTGHHLVQVVDPVTGTEVPNGVRGNLVINAFGLDAFYMRYDVEDIVVAEEGPCPCGETGQRYTFIGRGADRAEVDGQKILPLDIQLALFEFDSPEFQLKPGACDAVQLKVESDESSSAAKLAGDIGERIGVPVEVETIPVGSLPRSSFKPRRTA
ncbi:phenylacetate--CoA ligase family protein [Rhodococcus opacus]|uniref:phenylacetate--CoA ligase family protein n=1 Tax=Rhodococcus opacus TaxID=37919 RepID=UPI001056F6C2|nr:phenylacetate--CoA ligase family protein [Rhodococcus opacus]